MTLSPAAQAVLDAFHDRYELVTFNENWQEDCLSAALRALAVRIKGADAIRQDILDIADELDDVKYGTYRCNLEDKPQ